MVKVAVIGCGQMGVKIAGELAFHGHRVVMFDADVNVLNAAHDRIEEDKKQLQRDNLLPQHNFVGKILFASTIEETVHDADIVFEAISEDLKLKQSLFECVSQNCPVSTIIATNTLRLVISSVFENAVSKERTVGVRFLYPVYCIPEVEIIPSQYTSTETINKVRVFMEKMGKTLFFRSGDEPLILSEEQREFRKQARVEQIRNASGHGWHLENSVPALSHRGNKMAVPEVNSLSEFGKDCAICMDKLRDCLLCPCHHLVTCSDCAKLLINRRDGCPICRKEITEVIHVYHS